MTGAWSRFVSWCKRVAWPPKLAGWSNLNVTITPIFHGNDHYEVLIDLRYINSHALVDRTTNIDFNFPIQDCDVIIKSQLMLLIFEGRVFQGLEAIHVHQSHHPYISNNITNFCLALLWSRLETQALSYVIAFKEQPQIIESPKENVEDLLAAVRVIVKSRNTKACLPCSCAICLESIAREHDNNCTELKVAEFKGCSHIYHVDCFVQWVLKCGIVATFCPMCRAKLFVQHRFNNSFYYLFDLTKHNKTRQTNSSIDCMMFMEYL